MLTVSRVPRVMAAVLMSLALAVTALIPLGSAASAQQRYFLRIDAPATVDAGQPFDVTVRFTDQAGEIVYTVFCGSPVYVDLVIEGPDPGQDSAEVGVDGLATFVGVTLDIAGAYQLIAEVLDGPSCASWVADEASLEVLADIPADQPVAPCPRGDASCVQTWNGENTAATLIARSGSFTAKFVDNSELSCEGGHLEDDSVLEFDLNAQVRKLIIFALDRSVITKPLWRHQVCWSGETEFIPRGGGDPIDTGLLRHCRWGVRAPCILFKRWVQGGATIGVLAPPGDPKAYVR